MAEPEIMYLEVTPDVAGERLDRYIARTVETLSRSYIQNLILDDHIQVNQQTAKPAQVLRTGDTITIWLPPTQYTDLIPEDIPLRIMYEDEHIVVVDKVAGMVVHPSPGHSTGTLVHALLARYPDIRVAGTLRPGIVHRLDGDTSGLLVVARTDHAMQALTTQQKDRAMHKAYLALVEGHFKEPAGVIDAPIGRHRHDRKRQAIRADGREARTHYRVLEELGSYTLVEAVLETGRTHQIRVHFSANHHPILGDPLYGPRKPRATFGLKRQFLHAYKLGFTLPSDGTWREFTSPLHIDLEAALRKLRNKISESPR